MALSTGTQAPDTKRQLVAGAVFLAAVLIASLIGQVTQGGDVSERYQALEQPAWAPPSGAFGIVWPVLYVLIAVAAWRIWRTEGSFRAASTALGLWGVQLLVNAIWPGVFFGLEAFGPAVAVIVLLDLLVIATIVVFAARDRLAAGLMVPYLLWILYATALNAAIWRMN